MRPVTQLWTRIDVWAAGEHGREVQLTDGYMNFKLCTVKTREQRTIDWDGNFYKVGCATVGGKTALEHRREATGATNSCKQKPVIWVSYS